MGAFYSGSVTVQVDGVTVTAARAEAGFVWVNNTRAHLPVSLNNGALRLYQSGTSLILRTDFNIRVYYDRNNHLRVTVPNDFSDSLCGLWGNYNGDPSDDFRTPDGDLAPSVAALGKSWTVEDEDQFYWHDCIGSCRSCDPSITKKYKKEALCSLITKVSDGPFSQCHSKVDPTVYFDNCVYDLCHNEGNRKAQCEALKAYADTCQLEGVRIGEWRQLARCHDYATCSVTRNLHYATFDGQRYDFQGTCRYQLMALCKKAEGLVDFEVYFQENSTSPLQIKVYQTRLNISNQFPRKVLSVTYAGAVCGLCGNFNKDREEDLLMRDGTLAPSPVSSGQSWKLGDLPGCSAVMIPPCTNIEAIEKEQRGSRGQCGIILDKNGPFRGCHSKGDPDGYFVDCVYSYCVLSERDSNICQAVAGYAEACQEAGAMVHPWRTMKFCCESPCSLLIVP
nr:IgGFc-binding protein-like [Chelonoidis abingdonii]